VHLKILYMFDWSSKYIAAPAERLCYKFVLALAELNTWSFCQ